MLLNRLNRFYFTKNLSHFIGSKTNLYETTISKCIFDQSRERPDQLALISDFQNVQLTYSQLFEISRRAAANFIDFGLKPGDKFGIYAPNYIEWIICQFACSLADLHLVNINPAYKPGELLYGLKLADVDSLLVSDNVQPARILDSVDWLLLNGKATFQQNQDLGKHRN